jgi:DnaJ domain.
LRGEEYEKQPYSVFKNLETVAIDTGTALLGAGVGSAVGVRAGGLVLSAFADSGLSSKALRMLSSAVGGVAFGMTTATVDQIASGSWDWGQWGKAAACNGIFGTLSAYKSAPGDTASPSGDALPPNGDAAGYNGDYLTARKYFSDEDFSDIQKLETDYKGLAKQYHPDVSGSPDAGAIMTEINNAHDAALRYVSSNIIDQYMALKQQNVPRRRPSGRP